MRVETSWPNHLTTGFLILSHWVLGSNIWIWGHRHASHEQAWNLGHCHRHSRLRWEETLCFGVVGMEERALPDKSSPFPKGDIPPDHQKQAEHEPSDATQDCEERNQHHCTPHTSWLSAQRGWFSSCWVQTATHRENSWHYALRLPVFKVTNTAKQMAQQ